MSVIKCDDCKFVKYCTFQYNGGCGDKHYTPNDVKSIDDMLKLVDYDSLIEKKFNMRTLAIERFAQNTDINTLAKFVEFQDKSKYVADILDIFMYGDSFSARKLYIITGFNKEVIYAILNKLLEFGIIKYIKERDKEHSKNMIVKKWSLKV